MKKIHASDLLYVTMTAAGQFLLNISLSGINSLAELYERLRGIYPDARGLVTVQVRNSSQGWCARHNVAFMGAR